jgi:hypothetical protein
MPIDQSVFRAVLAMDSYNRGYRPHVNGLSDATGTMLGNAWRCQAEAQQC